MEYLERYKSWLNDNSIDLETKKELKSIENNDEEIKDRFYKDLEFGTAGLRGVIGNGSNRMNKYTVTKATQGLANYITKCGMQSKGVAIAYDSRNMSKEFSEFTALCLNANGIKTYVFESLRPVPELSFTVRELQCCAGIMITASHNPPKYNGYKVYWEDGAQIVPPHDKGIINEVNKITNFGDIKSISKDEAINQGLYNVIGKKIDEKYINTLKSYVLNPQIIKEMADDIKIVYTPLHGAGNMPVQRILKEIGFKNVFVVPEQEKPDGNFPTVSYPNPEDEKAFTLALKLAEKVNADIVLANDPDADRLGIYAKDTKTGKYKTFTGNMSGLLIAEYELSQKKAQNKIPENGALVKTIVSSKLADSIAKEYKLKLIEVLTGFKYIGEQIKKFEDTRANTYMFGFEESYGCLIGTYARDKDGISAVMALCEAAAYYKKQGYTLCDQMQNIYQKYGYFKETQISITKEGANGAEEINKIMNTMRNSIPEFIGKYKVLEYRDYKLNIIKNMVDNTETPTGLPNSNVLYYALENDAWCCVRPSGTEPKIKFYIGVKANTEEQATNELNELEKTMKKIAINE